MIQSLFNVKNIQYGFLALGIQILLATFSANVYGQPTFQRLYGTLDNDKGYSITGCSSGGYLVSGSTSNFYTFDTTHISSRLRKIHLVDRRCHKFYYA